MIATTDHKNANYDGDACDVPPVVKEHPFYTMLGFMQSNSQMRPIPLGRVTPRWRARKTESPEAFFGIPTGGA